MHSNKRGKRNISYFLSQRHFKVAWSIPPPSVFQHMPMRHSTNRDFFTHRDLHISKSRVRVNDFAKRHGNHKNTHYWYIHRYHWLIREKKFVSKRRQTESLAELSFFDKETELRLKRTPNADIFSWDSNFEIWTIGFYCLGR